MYLYYVDVNYSYFKLVFNLACMPVCIKSLEVFEKIKLSKLKSLRFDDISFYRKIEFLRNYFFSRIFNKDNIAVFEGNKIIIMGVWFEFDETPIHKSSILNFDFDFSIEWFKTLEGVQQLAVGIFLGKSVILSSLISIIFIFYGDILLDKYKIAEKYPKLAKIIELRKKYQKYYFKYNCLLIFMVIITEYMVSLSLLVVTL